MITNYVPKTPSERLRFRSYERDYTIFTNMLEDNPKAHLLDLGCKEGGRTLQFASKIGTTHITGVDIQDLKPSFSLMVADLNGLIPLPSEDFDVITFSQTIEHLSNTDTVVQEMYRLLKPGGYALVGTPNLASGRVILELLLNLQPNTAHVSDHFVLRGDPGQEWKKSEGYLHRRLFTIEGLSKLLSFYGFRIEKSVGVGYGPLPFLQPILRGRYAANIIVKARKL